MKWLWRLKMRDSLNLSLIVTAKYGRAKTAVRAANDP